MNVTYFKRFRMEVDLNEPRPAPLLPVGYFWVAWTDTLIDLHAEVKYLSFQEEIDTHVFPSLSSRQGCTNLMGDIRRRSGFLPGATWLVASPEGYCGTVQGIRDRGAWGAIQNLGVTLQHRGRGIGTALLLRALDGFARAGLGRAYLEVTAQNDAAVRLYRRLGFRCRKTLYRAAEGNQVLEPVGSGYW
jgi:ribosomal protein S18 acetylase RimI-like enzyme